MMAVQDIMTKKKKKTLKFTYLYDNDPEDARTDTYVGELRNGVFHGIPKLMKFLVVVF